MQSPKLSVKFKPEVTIHELESVDELRSSKEEEEKLRVKKRRERI